MMRLVVCFDSTGNVADSERAETNVTLIARTARPSQDRLLLRFAVAGFRLIWLRCRL